MLYDSIELPLVEVDGDGDDSVEPGETWSVRPKLRNAGGLPALGVVARLATTTAGVTILPSDERSFGDLAAGAVAPSVDGYHFVVEPDFGCGGSISFDLVDIRSTDPAAGYADQLGAFEVVVVGEYGTPTVTTLLDEDFDGAVTDWSHRSFNPNLWGCWNLLYKDEWNLDQKDAAHGMSYHAGKGPGESYATTNHAWLHYGGLDSNSGPGLEIPAEAHEVTLTLVHWYSTDAGMDGGQVVVDAQVDGANNYTLITPSGGYPGGTLATGGCNALEGKRGFQGSSGGWVTSTFDLSEYKGRKIYLAFVFGSDRYGGNPYEGWYIDQVKVEWRDRGPALCDVMPWPGRVDGQALFQLGSGGEIEASWSPSCNAGAVPNQTYAIQAGGLEQLFATGAYDHAPVGARCDRLSPSTFTPAEGQRYFLIVPVVDGREGGAGSDSSGVARPQPSSMCGVRREGACP